MLMTFFRKLLLVLALALLPGLAGAADLPKRHMVAAADPRAVEAGLAMLRAGGSAVDAAIATQMVLGLVEPQSSGIGGGAFLLAYDRASSAVRAYDGRETAPAAAGPGLFMGSNGQPLSFHEAAVGGRSVGVPGVIRLMELAHRNHGALPWSRLFAPAIALAEEGFILSPRLSASLAQERFLVRDPVAGPMFYNADGSAKPPGTLIRNPAYGAVLRDVAARGAGDFYAGDTASAMVSAVQGHANHGGMTLQDVATYQAKERDAICRPYRSYRVCTMPPPTSGGVALLQILGMLERFPLGDMAAGTAPASHLLLEAGRLAFADRDNFLADPDFVSVPVDGLLDRAYLTERSRLIDPARAQGLVRPGNPPRRGGALPLAPSTDHAVPATSHLSVVDGQGNAVSMTTTVEDAFGARVMVKGFLLNNQLTDFSFVPERDGQQVANRVEGGKRPRSSMTPALIFDRNGQLRFVVGSPGGARIIGYVAKAVIALLDHGLDPQSAAALPNVLNRNGISEIEEGPQAAMLAEALKTMGHQVHVGAMTSGLHLIAITEQGMKGGADPRREGSAQGD